MIKYSEEYFQVSASLRGLDLEETVKSLNQLLRIYEQEGNLKAIERVCNDYLKRRTSATIYDEQTFVLIQYLVRFYIQNRQFRLAEVLLTTSISEGGRYVGDTHEFVLALRHYLGLMYHMQMDYLEASRVLTTCLESCNEALGSDHPLTMAVRQTTGKNALMLLSPEGMNSLLGSMIMNGMRNNAKTDKENEDNHEKEEVSDDDNHQDQEEERSASTKNNLMRALMQQMGFHPIKVIYASYLKKVGSFIPSVRNRWFVLTDDGMIRYYTDDTCDRMKGEFPCLEILEMTALREKEKNKFEWNTSEYHKGRFQLQCESKDIYIRWKEFLTVTGVLIRNSNYSNREFYPNGKNNELTY